MKRILVLAITLFLLLCVAHTAVAQDINERAAARRSLLEAIENGDRRAVLREPSLTVGLRPDGREPSLTVELRPRWT